MISMGRRIHIVSLMVTMVFKYLYTHLLHVANIFAQHYMNTILKRNPNGVAFARD